MGSFYSLRNKDAGDGYADALTGAGFVEVEKLGEADFALIDHEHVGLKRYGLEVYLEDHPIFVYPHTPLAYFLWDGHYEPLPVACNFVAGEGARESMRLYGYPHRVEACGFTRCQVRAFTPTTGSRLLFVPARTRSNGDYASREYEAATMRAFRFVLDHRTDFEQVTVCYVNNFVNECDYLTTGIQFIKTDPRNSETPTNDMLEHIERADLVISCETVGCLAVARGKPTIFYNARAVATTSNIPAANFERYRHIYQFPLTLEEMDIEAVMATREHQNSAVEFWKEQNIGSDFDAAKFLDIVGDCLR